MNNNTTAPTYTLRGLQLIGWRDMQHALDYLFADGQLKQAVNHEPLAGEDDDTLLVPVSIQGRVTGNSGVDIFA